MTIQYDPQKVTDWVTPLEKVYARQSQQLDRYHNQLRERDRQEQAATINLPEIASQLASFSKTIGQVMEARETNQQKKTDFDWNQFSNPDQIRLEKLIKEGSVIDDHNEFMKTIANDTTLSSSAKLSLQSKSGAYFHRLRKTIGFQKINNAYYDLNKEINTEGSKHALAYARVKHDPKQAQKYIDDYIGNELTALGFDKDAIFHYFGSAIADRSRSKAHLDSINETKIRLAEHTATLGSNINTQNELINTDPHGVARLLQSTIFENTNKALGIDQTQAKHNVSVQIERLLDTGEIQYESVIANNYGLVEHPSGDITVTESNQDQYPGFKIGAKLGKGELLFGIEDQKQWLAASNRYKKRIIAENTANVINQGISIEASIAKGDRSIEELTELKNNGLDLIERTLGKEHKSYKSLNNLDVTLQKPESYAAIKEEWQPYYNGNKKGQRLQNEATIKEIQNVKVRNELLDLIKEDKAIRSSIGYPATFKVNNDLTGEKIINANETLNEESHLTGAVGHMQIEITQKRDWFLADALDRFPDDPQTAFGQADEAWEKWLTKEGFYVTADKPGAGRFSPETTGEYKNYKMWRSADLESRGIGDQKNLIKWGSKVSKAKLQSYLTKEEGENETERVLNTVNSVTDPEDLIGVWVTGNPVYSPEIIIKARLLRTQPSNLVKKQLQALIKSPDKRHQLLVKRFGLVEKLKNLKTPDIDLEEKIIELGNRDLISIVKNGINYASPKQLKRILDELEKETNRARHRQIVNEGLSDEQQAEN